MVISVPHAGRLFPKEFLENIAVSEKELRASEDCFVDELLMKASDAGIPMISMNISRSFVDANRDKIELDASMFYDYPHDDNCQDSNRCKVGLGVIHRVADNKKNIYADKISYKEAMERIKNVYDPYHKRLAQLIDKAHKKFGFCFVLDCHSMPSKICSMLIDDKQIEVCIGTLFEQSCPASLYEFMKKEWVEKGYNALYNCPYSGAYITFNYCQPRKKTFSMQLEVNRALYLQEKTYKKNNNFQKLSDDLGGVVLNFAKKLLDFKF